MRAISEPKESRSREFIDWSAASFHNRKCKEFVAFEVLDQLRAGVIISNSDGQVVEMNRAAESVVRLDDGLNIRNGRLCARRTFETAKVAKLIAHATADTKLGVAAGRMLVGRCDGLPPYVLTVAPLRANMAVAERRLALIVVVDPQRHAPSEADLAEFFGLSPAEARLAAALLTGKTLAQIAAGTGVRITTLRTQLGSILRKVGAVRSDPYIVKHRDRHSVLLGRVVQYCGGRYANAPVVLRGITPGPHRAAAGLCTPLSRGDNKAASRSPASCFNCYAALPMIVETL